jgi:predicted kinase
MGRRTAGAGPAGDHRRVVSQPSRPGAGHRSGPAAVPLYVIECTCPDELVKIRLEKRQQDRDNPSDGRWEILAQQKKEYEAICEIPAASHFRVDTSDQPELARRQIIRTIKMAEFQAVA